MRNFKGFKPNALMLIHLFAEIMHKKVRYEINKNGITKKLKRLCFLPTLKQVRGLAAREEEFKKNTSKKIKRFLVK